MSTDAINAIKYLSKEYGFDANEKMRLMIEDGTIKAPKEKKEKKPKEKKEKKEKKPRVSVVSLDTIFTTRLSVLLLRMSLRNWLRNRVRSLSRPLL